VTVFIDDEILYRQFITENGFENVSLHRKDRLKHLSKRLKMHSNWSLSYNPVVNNNLWKLLVGTTADKGCSLRKKQYNTVNNKLLKQKHIRKTSDLIKEGVANIIFFDIEMNCNSDKNNKSGTWEAISLGAVKYNINDNSIDKFYSLIKPKCNTILSDRCIELTSISQTKIDNANNFKVVMLDFEKWIGHEKSMFLSWGVEDIRVIRNDNKKNGLRLEIVNYMRKHFIDFQKEFCSYYLNSKQLISIGNVLAIFDLDFEGSIMHWMMHLIYIEFINIIKVDVKKHTHSLYLYKWGMLYASC
jgi:inhibitor of KinA sporulation pathway (predicted exonuclease)